VIAGDLALALDPVRLAHRAGIEPDNWQAAALRSASPRLLLNCCRQSGKSTTVATIAVHAALFEPGALVLLVSPSLRQSAELFKKAVGLYRALGRPVPAAAGRGLPTPRPRPANPGRAHSRDRCRIAAPVRGDRLLSASVVRVGGANGRLPRSR